MDHLSFHPFLIDGQEEGIQQVYARAVDNEEMAGAELSD